MSESVYKVIEIIARGPPIPSASPARLRRHLPGRTISNLANFRGFADRQPLVFAD
jgi:hypothetical protein